MQHFLSIADTSADVLHGLIDHALFLKKEYQTGGNRPVLQGKSLAMYFQKPSLRTRVSFEMAMQHVGGYVFYIGPTEIGLGKRESIADIARVLEGYVSGVMMRVFDHNHLIEYAKWSDIPLINGLSDYNHPCQGMADVLTIYEEFGTAKDLQVVYVGDSNNVTRSLAFAAAKFGFQLIVSSPEGYTLDQETIDKACEISGLTDTVVLEGDLHQAVKSADVIYTDTWVSMGQEEETAKRREVFPPYQVNKSVLASAPDHAIVMHCLPAHRGDEITDEVADGPQSRLFPQAHNRLHAQKAILVDMLK